MFRTQIRQNGVDVVYTPGFIPREVGGRLFEAVLNEAAWEQPRIRVFGREHLVPRLVAWHADGGCSYSYSGQEHRSMPWTPALQEIREIVESVHGQQHAVLANLYRDGKHGIAPHADDEAELDADAPILMVSLGAVRRFVIKHRATKERHVLRMEEGSLLEMRGLTNTVAVHGVPKTKQAVGPRISLTFRRMAALR